MTAACLAVLLGTGVSARALDLFTLWRQPDLPLDLTPGSWADYRHQTMTGGRRDTDLTRVVCLAAPEGRPAGDRVFEVIPLQEDDQGRLEPVPGQGVWLLVSGDIARRSGDLWDLVREAWQWDGGEARRLSVDQMRQDPLTAGFLQGDFAPDKVEHQEPATRIIDRRQFLCSQMVLSARDTQSVDLPAGRMLQTSLHEVTAAFNPELPLLGVAYAAERISSQSSFETPNPRFHAPAPRIRVEVMELVAFGRDGVSVLGRGH